jgi:hypothetical protein
LSFCCGEIQISLLTLFSILLAIFMEVELLVYVAIQVLVLVQNYLSIFHSVCTFLHSSKQYGGFQYSCQNLFSFLSFLVSHPSECEVNCHYDCILLMISDAKHLCVYLLPFVYLWINVCISLWHNF